MTNLEFLRLSQAALQVEADGMARLNGVCRERSLDEYRYHAGMVQGLMLASTLIEDTLRNAAKDFDDDD